MAKVKSDIAQQAIFVLGQQENKGMSEIEHLSSGVYLAQPPNLLFISTMK